jgi:hypothetical protein
MFFTPLSDFSTGGSRGDQEQQGSESFHPRRMAVHAHPAREFRESLLENFPHALSLPV